MEQTTQQDLTAAYETTTCGRCGGGGHYSYCQSHGTTCFGCSGKGRVYTKRANAAIEYARALRTVKVTEVQVGWLLFVQGGPLGGKTGWFAVTASGFDGAGASIDKDGVRHPFWGFQTSQGGICISPEGAVQAVPCKARLQEVKDHALAYQATLTKTGKPAKNQKAAA